MPTLFKRSNGVYYISFEEGDKRKWKSTGERQKPAALKVLLNFEQSRKPTSPKVSLQSFIKDFLAYAEVSCSPKSVRLYRNTLRNFLSVIGDKLLVYVTPKDVDEFRTQRLRQVSPVSVNVDLRMLRAAFYTALRWKLLPENPFTRVSFVRIPDQQPVYLSKEDIQRLLLVVSEAWLKELILVAVSTGLRRGELLNLKWKDVDFERRILYIQSSDDFRTKAGRRRAVPMSEPVLQILWSKGRRSLSENVFTLNGSRISEDWLTHRFKSYIRKASLNPKLHFHSLRHTFATWLVQEGVSIYEVQKLLGHSSISVTQVYSHLAASELHGAVNKIQVVLN